MDPLLLSYEDIDRLCRGEASLDDVCAGGVAVQHEDGTVSRTTVSELRRHAGELLRRAREQRAAEAAVVEVGDLRVRVRRPGRTARAPRRTRRARRAATRATAPPDSDPQPAEQNRGAR